ncbi:MAG: hypothetical protein ACKO8I_15335 [Cyanobacteriota bacterium]
MAEPDSNQFLWEQARASFAEADWPELEGGLLRLLELEPGRCDLLDLLGHALLMQGRFAHCRQVLEEALGLGCTSFWTPHKLGDAHRGLQHGAAAIAAYEQALQWESDSPLTVRNLLEVLHGEDPSQAIARLERFAAADPAPWLWQEPPPWLEGAIQAACRVHGTVVAEWLCEHGCPAAEVRAVVWQERLHSLKLAAALQLLETGDHPRERALAARVRHLLQHP